MSLFTELKRRNVIRVGIAYLVAAWLVIQVAATIFPLFGLDETPSRIVVILLAIGFPLFLVFSWIFEITPEGLKREADIEHTDASEKSAARQLNRLIIILLTLAVGYFSVDKFLLEPARDAALMEETAQQVRSEALLESYGDKSIAVLPFVNMSDDASNEYFAEGMSEEILNLLVKIPELRVISRSSAFSFKGQAIEIPEIAERLNVAHILEGSVRKAGKRLRITAQLIEARSDTHLWSETYDRELNDVFAVQDEISGEIARQLQLTLIAVGQSRIPTQSEEAYDQYLRGLHFLRQTSAHRSFAQARDHFQAAIELDPGFAEAYAQLAIAFIGLGNFRLSPPLEVFPLAQDAVSKALELDADLYDAQIALGWLMLSFQRDWAASEKAFRRAIELVPGDYQGHQGLAWPLQATGRINEALISLLKAREIDPLSYWTRDSLASIYFMMRNYEAAIKLELVTLELVPDDALTNAWLAQIYAHNQQPMLAHNYVRQAASLPVENPNHYLGIALVYAVLDEDGQAREFLDKIDLQAGSAHVSPGYLAAVYANLGEPDLAMDNLQQAVETFDSWIFNLNYPVWDPIRDDPRFMKLCDSLKMVCTVWPITQ